MQKLCYFLYIEIYELYHLNSDQEWSIQRLFPFVSPTVCKILPFVGIDYHKPMASFFKYFLAIQIKHKILFFIWLSSVVIDSFIFSRHEFFCSWLCKSGVIIGSISLIDTYESRNFNVKSRLCSYHTVGCCFFLFHIKAISLNWQYCHHIAPQILLNVESNNDGGQGRRG